jgi:hypothetical protein
VNNIEVKFIAVSGYYVVEPLQFMHIWNQASSIAEVVNLIHPAWENWKANNVLLKNKKGLPTNPPAMTGAALVARAKAFRKRGVAMKEFDRYGRAAYDWEHLISESKVYTKSRSKFKF